MKQFSIPFPKDLECPAIFFGKIITRDKKKGKKFYADEVRLPGLEVINGDQKSLNTAPEYMTGQWVCCKSVRRESERVQDEYVYIANNGLLSPVQVIPWDYVNESKKVRNAKDFFIDSDAQRIMCTDIPLIGGPANKGGNGHVIIYDSETDSFFKGFSHVGGGDIECLDVKCISRKDFWDVENVNLAAPMAFDANHQFLLLLPKEENSHASCGAHAVLDVGSWEELKVSRSRQPLKAKNSTGSMRPGNVHANSERGNESNLQVLPPELPPQFTQPVLPPLAHKATQKGQRNTGACDWNKDELAFLKNFIADCKKCGYEYDAQDIVRFHTCVKCGMFTLLGGAPGCGKSTLAALYARALSGNKKVDAKSGFLTVDVNPAWLEPSDVLGHWNLNGGYVCADTGLVPFLRKLNGPLKNNVGIVCLEEMNLSRVEHYFSNFMQLISRPDDERLLLGVPSDDSQDEKNAVINVPRNLRFIGTNNFDETTQRFSARFYDRCNYLELKPNSNDVVFPTETPSFDRGEFNYQVTFGKYSSWCNTSIGGDAIDNTVVEKFKYVTEKLSDLRLTPSPRVRLEMAKYIVNRPFFDGCGTDKTTKKDCQMIALDEAIVQRVLSRYRFDYLRDETAARKDLLDALRDMPISHEFFKSKITIGERPSRI